MLWIAFITASFILAAIMVRANVNDAAENPISTSINTIPVQDIPFPAISLSGVYLEGPGRLPEAFLNSFEFDCMKKGHECMQETAPLKSDMFPLIKHLVHRLHNKANVADEWFPIDMSYLPHDYFCIKLRRNFNLKTRSLVIGLSQLYSQSSNKTALENDILKVIASTFRMSEEQISKKFKWYFSKKNKKDLMKNSYLKYCLGKQQTTNVSRDSAAFSFASILTSGLFGWDSRRYEIILGNLLARYETDKLRLVKWVDVIRSNKQPHNEFVPKLEYILSKIPGNNTMLSSKSIMYYLKYQWAPAKFDSKELLGCHMLDDLQSIWYPQKVVQFCATNNTWPCCDIEFEISKDMHTVWKVMKYTLALPGRRILEKGELQDLELVKGLGYKLNDMHYLYNTKPLVSACKYGSETMEPNCNLFRKLFTTTGIGYTFNNEPFYSLFKETKDNFAFFKEMHELKGNYVGKKPRMILSNGQEHSFDFILNHFNREDLASQENQKLVIHDPSDIADTRKEAINLKPGMAYEVSITPSVIVTDPKGLQLDPAKRNCLSQKEGESLETFRQYRQSSCFFECHLKKVIDKCNCTAWDYPRLRDNVNLCWHPVAKGCFEKELKSSDFKNCACPNDCDSVHYSIGLQVTPLDADNICGPTSWKNALSRMLIYFLPPRQELLNVNGVVTLEDETCIQRVGATTYVKVYVAPKTVSQIVRTTRVSFSSQLANLGGIIGLFTGMSILSLAEIVFWMLRFLKSWLNLSF